MIHEGHRQRIKKRFREEGLDGFTDIQILELLLFYCIPQGDTNPIAHELLNRFGSLHQVLEAPRHELEKVPGIKEHSSTLISLIPQLARRYSVSQASLEKILNTTSKCGEYLKPFFTGISRGFDPLGQIKVNILSGKGKPSIVDIGFGGNSVPGIGGMECYKLLQCCFDICRWFFHSFCQIHLA